MLIGVLSDSHGRAQRLRLAIRQLRNLGAEALLHCGDVGGESSLDELAAARLPVWFAWGNTDLGALDPTLQQYCEQLGLRVPPGAPVRVELGGRRIEIYHGHEREFEQLLDALRAGQAVAEGQPDYVLCGHTHMPADVRTGGVRIVNPGALHRAARYTVATIDLAQDTVRHWVIDDEATGPPAPYELPG